MKPAKIEVRLARCAEALACGHQAGGVACGGRGPAGEAEGDRWRGNPKSEIRGQMEGGNQ